MLSSEEIADFEKFVLSMIPPELFNLYFFDGEKIADFFMNEGSNARIKEAFLTLCGYDTFDIMRRNFKRISGGSSTSAPALDAYWEAKQEAEQAQRMYQSLLRDLSECEDAIATCEADIAALEKAYAEKASFSCTAAFASLLFHEQRGRRKGGFFTRSPMGDGMDMVDMAWAVLADIACSIHEQAVNLQELTGNHPNEIFGCGGGFLVEQIVPGMGKQLHGNAANARFLHALLDGQHALAGIAHRVILTGKQQNGRGLVPALIGVFAAGALHGAQKLPE